MKGKHLLAAAVLAGAALSASAQKKDFGYKFYGQVRTDLYYNTVELGNSGRIVLHVSARQETRPSRQ